MELFGQIFQIEVGPFDFFLGCSVAFLHNAIHDAKGKITFLWIECKKCINNDFHILEETIQGCDVRRFVYFDSAPFSTLSNLPCSPLLRT